MLSNNAARAAKSLSTSKTAAAGNSLAARWRSVWDSMKEEYSSSRFVDDDGGDRGGTTRLGGTGEGRDSGIYTRQEAHCLLPTFES